MLARKHILYGMEDKDMKFNVGDAVKMRHAGRLGRITAVLGFSRVMVQWDSGLLTPAQNHELEKA